MRRAVLAVFWFSGCGLSGGVPADQRPVCSAYIECVSAVSPGTLSVVIDAFGEDGNCWDEQGVEACEASCALGRDQLDFAEDAPAACTDGPADDPRSDCEVIDDVATVCPELDGSALDEALSAFAGEYFCGEEPTFDACIAETLRECSDAESAIMGCF